MVFLRRGARILCVGAVRHLPVYALASSGTSRQTRRQSLERPTARHRSHPAH
jgi:hypothetical protein